MILLPFLTLFEVTGDSMEELLGEVLSHIGKAKSANDPEELKTEAWMARANLELFLIKLVLLHGLEEVPSPPPPRVKRNDPERDLKLLNLAEEKVREAKRAFGEENYLLTYDNVWEAKNALTKIVTSTTKIPE
ncbi:MAG: hypothetical protein ACTSRV_04780 [Candidatus Freyarchaeota archaeon]